MSRATPQRWFSSARTLLSKSVTKRRVARDSSPLARLLRIEPLEDRRLLAITVNTLVDEADGSIVDGDISLRDAIAASPAGGTINFSVTGTINLALGAVVVQDRIIQGPGAAQLTINAHNASNVFTTRGTTTLSGLTITGGGTTLRGGGIRNESVTSESHLTVTNSVITGNTALFQGGGIDGGGSIGLYGSVTVVNSTISGNRALAIQGNQYGQGGGIYSGYAYLTVDKSTISGNHADRFGGGIYGGVTMTNSTVSGNSAGDGTFDDGGGIFVRGQLSVVNSTISGNAGTGIRFINSAVGVVANSTITNNDIGIVTYGGATLLNTIVAGNGDDNNFDITGTVDVSGSRNNLIGDPSNPEVVNGGIGGPPAGGLTNGVNGNIVDVADAGLGPLANNGGQTQTHALFSFSPAINRGDNSLIPINPSTGLPFTIDQTGAARIFGDGTVDLGAVEVQGAVVPSTIVNTATDDVAANSLTSLREAIGFARTLGGSVTFNPTVFATPQTIALVYGQITLNGATIIGPGAALATVNTGGASPVFVNQGVTHISGLTVTGVTMGGSVNGAVENTEDGALTIQDCVISGNAASGIANLGTLVVSGSTISDNHSTVFGGGIFVKRQIVPASITTIVNSTISGNSASGDGGGVFSNGTVTIRNSTISGNSTLAERGGGGISQYTGSLTILNSIVAGNLKEGSPNDISAPDGLNPASAYNLIGDTATAGGLLNGVNGNIVGINPALVIGPLANNGGPTPTHALLPGSPAIDAGDPNAVPGVGDTPFSDQRGEARRFDGNGIEGLRIDIGAFEAPTVPPQLPGDYNLDRNVGAADYVAWRKIRGFFVAPPYYLADGDGNQMIDQLDYNVWRSHFGQSLPAAGTAQSNTEPQQLAAATSAAAATNSTSDAATVPTTAAASGAAPANVTKPAISSPLVSIANAEDSPRARKRQNAMAASDGAAATSNDNALLAWLSSRRLKDSPRSEHTNSGGHPNDDSSQPGNSNRDSVDEIFAGLANCRFSDL